MEKEVSKQPPESFEFPQRPVLAERVAGYKVTLATNSYSLYVKTSNYIYVYAVKFIEEIPANNTPLRKLVVRGLKSELESALKLYLFTGSMLYSPTDLGMAPKTFELRQAELKYSVELTRAHMISVQDIMHPHQDLPKAQTARTFLNIIVKSLLSACGMFPVGRTGKYLLPSGAKKIPEYGIEVWPGYYTSVNLYEAGLLLEVDFASRILREESVYDYLRGRRQQLGERFIEQLKEELVGHSVLARYGNKRTYVVSDIDFTRSPASCEFEGPKGKLSVEAYFREKYLIQIKDKTQPLLVTIHRHRDGKQTQAFLVPELCSLTGLPTEYKEDHVAMRQLAVYTRLTPDQRVHEVMRLLRSFSRPEGSGSPRLEGDGPLQSEKLMRDWNLQVDLKPVEVQGRVLPPMEIQLAGTKVLQVNEQGQFNFKEPIKAALPLEKWVLLYTERDKAVAENFVNVLHKAAQTFGINVDYPTYGETRGVRGRDFIETLEGQMGVLRTVQMAVFILPPPSYNEYGLIKKYATTRTPPLFTQMIKSRTLANLKNQMAVCSKVVLQMNAKRNGELWRVKVPTLVPRKTMVVGIDVARESHCTCLGLAASYDPFFSRFCTLVMPLEDRKELCSALGVLFVKALERFLQETKKFLPELIVIYRDGLSNTQRRDLFIAELQHMLKAVKTRFADYNPKILFLTINKKIHTRFFMKPLGDSGREGGREVRIMANPRPGTLVDTGIVDSHKYEFLIMPQYVNEGTGTPSKLQVLYDTSGLGLDTVEELTNTLCYDYFNWQGPIRTPAPCKYAFSHARLVAKHTKSQPTPELMSFLHFL